MIRQMQHELIQSNILVVWATYICSILLASCSCAQSMFPELPIDTLLNIILTNKCSLFAYLCNGPSRSVYTIICINLKYPLHLADLGTSLVTYKSRSIWFNVSTTAGVEILVISHWGFVLRCINHASHQGEIPGAFSSDLSPGTNEKNIHFHKHW